MDNQNTISNKKTKNALNSALKQIFGVPPEISKQNSQTSLYREQLSTQMNDSFDVTVSPSLRQELIGDQQKIRQIMQYKQNNENNLRNNKFKIQQSNISLNVKGHSPTASKVRALSQLSTCSSNNTPLNREKSQNQQNVSSSQSLIIGSNHVILGKLPKIYPTKETSLHKIYFFPHQMELDKFFHRPVNQEKAKLYSFINQNQITRDNQIHKLVYKKLAPITCVYNQSQVFENKKIVNQDQNESSFPRYYFKQNKQRIEKQFGNQYAYLLINDINLQKKLSMMRLISTKNTKVNLDSLQHLNQA